tara:strand:- start:2911 stop:3459 length:549 start_codon:yes stop_codon:yes gene_type:complete
MSKINNAIYDEMGQFIRFHCTGEALSQGEYLAPLTISSGAGISKKVFNHFTRGDLYPSLNHIKNYSTKKRIGAFVLNMQGVVSHQDKSIIDYQIIIDARESEESLQAYVLNPICENIQHVNIFKKGVYSIYPSREMCGICLGVEFTNQFQAIEDEQERIGWFLNHVNDVLMNPNPTDAARSI